MTFPATSPAPQMSDAQHRMFARLLRDHCGLHFGQESRFLLEKRIGRRLRSLEIDSFAAYHYLVRSGSGEELASLVDELTTNETYFFRESGQLRALMTEILPELRLRRRGGVDGPVALWSAGCSSGEEPYSVVMLALEAGFEPGVDLRVYASDISRRMLHKARLGEYREASFREADPCLREKYFLEKGGLWRIRDEVKRHVDFVHGNLLDRSKVALLGTLDVILCRNVIIYFDAESKRRVIQTFWDKLRPGGHLLLGHSESLINLSSSFELRQLSRELVYRRPHTGFAGAAAVRPEAGEPVGSVR